MWFQECAVVALEGTMRLMNNMGSNGGKETCSYGRQGCCRHGLDYENVPCLAVDTGEGGV